MATVAGIAGSIIGFAGNVMQADAARKSHAETAAASIAGENVRELQMQFESQRKRRQQVREAVLARSMSLTAAASQGAQKSSGAASGMAGATAQGAENAQTTTSAEILGSRVFRANRLYHISNANAQSQGAVGSGFTAFGQGLFQNQDAIGRILGVNT
jgi:hypothetical protein